VQQSFRDLLIFNQLGLALLAGAEVSFQLDPLVGIQSPHDVRAEQLLLLVRHRPFFSFHY
jgi:hypothetical protein